MDTVNLTFRYVEQDYVRAMRAHYASRLRLPLDIAVIVGGVAIGVYEWRSGSQGFGIALLSVLGIFALMLVAAFAVIPTIAFRREPKFRDDYSLSFSPQGIHFQTAHIDSDLKWSCAAAKPILRFPTKQNQILDPNATTEWRHELFCSELCPLNKRIYGCFKASNLPSPESFAQLSGSEQQ
jgi:hypothetical protein